MATGAETVWAIDIGNNCLKGLRLGLTENGGIEVLDFDSVDHGKVLSGSGVKESERNELIAISLRKFIENHSFEGDDLIVSVPSQNSFARFVNLPPVEEKRLPEIVKFEASQQIPFDINEVQWDWQVMGENVQGQESQKSVGIFAIKNNVAEALLERFKAEEVTVRYLQLAPMALYNFVLYDREELGQKNKKAIVVLDIGAENSDLVVCTPTKVWQRNIPIGGNAFTKAIAEAFKLNFHKAERLKRTAPMSKYARQIFQAMRPIYRELGSEVQRSLNYYVSSNADTKVIKVIAFGGGTKLRGLLKYLHQTLQLPVEKPESFKKLSVAPEVSAARFHERVSDFGITYGLGVQALGFGNIECNLLPRSETRSIMWASKAKYFILAASLLLVVSILSFAKTSFDRVSYSRNDNVRSDIKQVINEARQAQDKLERYKSEGQQYESMLKELFEPFNYRNVLPRVYTTVVSQLPNAENNPGQAELYKAFERGDVEKVKEIPRKQRKQIFITSFSSHFTPDVNTTSLSGIRIERGTDRESEERGRREARAQRRMGRGEGSYQPSFMREAQAPAKAQRAAGFVVTMTGYSPYKNLFELIDPARAGENPDRWGFVTRLMHLDRMVADGNSPFKLFKKTSTEHFQLDIGPVELASDEMPAGIGEPDIMFTEKKEFQESQQKGVEVLVDPMTKEPISKVPRFENGKMVYNNLNEPVYEVNDHWFVLKFKLVWEEAPGADRGQSAESGGTGLRGSRRRR